MAAASWCFLVGAERVVRQRAFCTVLLPNIKTIEAAKRRGLNLGSCVCKIVGPSARERRRRRQQHSLSPFSSPFFLALLSTSEILLLLDFPPCIAQTRNTPHVAVRHSVLRCAVLRCAVLCCTLLCGAVLGRIFWIWKKDKVTAADRAQCRQQPRSSAADVLAILAKC